jgi:hypothetical protein
MKPVCVVLLGICLQLLASPALGDSFSGIAFSPAPVATLQFGQHLDVSFNYNVTTPGGVLVFVRPFTGGHLTPSYAAGGGALCPVGSGSGSGYFTITAGDATIDEVRFQVYTPDQTTLLLEFFVPVLFYYSSHGIYNIELTPSSPSMAMFGHHVDIAFNYKTNQTGGVRIRVLPYTQGAATFNYSVSSSPLYAIGTGSGSQYITITSGDADVDAIRFRMYTSDYSTLLLELFVPVAYAFRVASAYNIQFTPAWPAGLRFGEHANVTFEYQATEAGGVRIFPLPLTNGSYTAHWGASSSPLYPAGSGTGAGFVTVTAEEATVDAIQFLITNADQSRELARYQVPVNYHFADDVVRTVSCTPPSPAYFSLQHHEDLVLSYTHDAVGGAWIWARPYTDGAPAPDGFWQGSENVPMGSGTVSRYLSVDANPAVVDQIYLGVMGVDGMTQLSNWLIASELHFGNQPSVTGAPTAPAIIPLGAFIDFPNPLGVGGIIRWRLAEDAHVSLGLFDITGRRVATLLDAKLSAGLCDAPLSAPGFSSGIYFLRLRADATGSTGRSEVDSRKILILR